MKTFSISILFLLVFSTTVTYGQIGFGEVAQSVGIDHYVLNNGVGGSVSFVDFDDDGDDDITLASEFGIPIAFYRNDDGQFTRISPFVNNIDNIKQIIWVDFDNDGDKDLYVNAFPGVNRLYENNGLAGFEDITATAELSMDTDRSYGAIWADFNRDGWLDLYTQERRVQTSGMPNFNRLYLNDADRSFTEVTMTAGVDDSGRIPFCAGAFDYNDDKWPDIYIANDRKSRNTLLRNNKDGTFTDVSELTGTGIEMDGMSVTVGDYDRDGDQDVYVTNIEDGNVLLRNDGIMEGTDEVYFTDVAVDAGVVFNSIGWGAHWLDGDNDGDLDLYVSGSLQGTSPLSAAFYENDGSGDFFRPVIGGMAGDTLISYNNAIGDFNGDGRSDIAVFNNPPFRAQLWQNTSGGAGNWIKLRLQGVLSSKDAVGSKIELYTNGQYQQRYIHCGQGFISQNSFVENVGLGDATNADSIIVTWPTGHIDKFINLPGGEQHLLVEGASTNGEIDVDDDVEIVITSNRDIPILDETLVIVRPNLTSDIFEIDTELDIQQIYLINGMGQQIRYAMNATNQIDVSKLPAGLYIVNLISDRGMVSKKVIVSR